MINRYRSMMVFGMVAAAGLAATHALAQAPTDAQRNAIKSACRSDYMSKCASVPPGGAAALQCLQKNMAGLSAGCQAAVKAVEPAAEAKPLAAPAAAAAPSKPATEAAPAAMPATVQSKPASETRPVVAAPAAEPSRTPAEPAAAAVPAKPAAAAAAVPSQPSEAQVAAIRSACRSDYPSVCAGVPTGGAAALQCLQQNRAKLSAGCAGAVAAASGAAAPAAAGTAAAPVTTAAVAPAMVLRPMRPLEEARVVRTACGADVRTLCAVVEPGGGRIVRCLASNAGALSPACKSMLATFAVE